MNRKENVMYGVQCSTKYWLRCTMHGCIECTIIIVSNGNHKGMKGIGNSNKIPPTDAIKEKKNLAYSASQYEQFGDG